MIGRFIVKLKNHLRLRSCNLTGTQTACANMHCLRGAVNNNLNLLDICLLLSKCTTRNL